VWQKLRNTATPDVAVRRRRGARQRTNTRQNHVQAHGKENLTAKKQRTHGIEWPARQTGGALPPRAHPDGAVNGTFPSPAKKITAKPLPCVLTKRARQKIFAVCLHSPHGKPFFPKKIFFNLLYFIIQVFTIYMFIFLFKFFISSRTQHVSEAPVSSKGGFPP
jgi:hypothetical protein